MTSRIDYGTDMPKLVEAAHKDPETWHRAMWERSKSKEVEPMTHNYNVIHTETNGRIGSIELKHPGWFFISNVSSHKGSRVGRATAEECFPRWARKMGCIMVKRTAQ